MNTYIYIIANTTKSPGLLTIGTNKKYPICIFNNFTKYFLPFRIKRVLKYAINSREAQAYILKMLIK